MWTLTSSRRNEITDGQCLLWGTWPFLQLHLLLNDCSCDGRLGSRKYHTYICFGFRIIELVCGWNNLGWLTLLNLLRYLMSCFIPFNTLFSSVKRLCHSGRFYVGALSDRIMRCTALLSRVSWCPSCSWRTRTALCIPTDNFLISHAILSWQLVSYDQKFCCDPEHGVSFHACQLTALC